MKLSVAEADIDTTNNSVRADILSLPHSSLSQIYINEEKIDSKLYNVKSGIIYFGDIRISKIDDIQIYIDLETKRINIERYATIIVAAIGLVGTIVSSLIASGNIPIFNGEDNTVIFEPDHYGLNESDKKFQAIIRWEKPSAKNYAFSSTIINDHMGWAFVRFREVNDNIMSSVVHNPVGPFPIRNGSAIEVALSDEIIASYRIQNKWLQLIVVALPENMRLTENTTLSNLGDNVKILLSPSIRPRP